METMRDIVVIVFSVTGTIASVVMIVMGFKLYGRTAQALEQVGRVSEDIHDAAEGARSGVRLAKGVLEVVDPALAGPRFVAMAHQVAATIPRAVRFISRIKRPSASTHTNQE